MFCNALHNRKKSPELIAVQAFIPQILSQNYRTSEVAYVVKKYAQMFCGGCSEDLVDALFRCLRQQECAQGTKPIVWPSNRHLCDRLKRTKSTIQRNFRKLSDHGLIAYRDSPNGKRFKNDWTGETFGIDLTPMFERLPEIAALVKQEEKRQQQETDLKRKSKALERSLKHCVENVNSNADKPRFAVHLETCRDLQHQVDLINSAAMTLQERFEAFEILHAKSQEILIEAYSGLNSLCCETAPENAKMGLNRQQNGAHQYNLDSPYLNDVCTNTTRRAVAPRRAARRVVFVDLAPEQRALAELEKSLLAFEKEKWKPQKRMVFENPVRWREDDKRRCGLTFGLVKSAIFNVQAEFGEVNSYAELVDLIPQMKVSVQLHQHAINLCLKTHGFQYLAVCLAIAIEKQFREPAKIRNAAGYAVALFKLDKRSASTKITRTLKHLEKSYKPDNVSEVLAV